MSAPKRTGFTSGEPQIATERDLKASWSGYPNAAAFECEFCGHKFAIGDQYRWIYANGNSPSAGNFMVCAACDGDNADLIAVRQKAIALLDRFHEHHAEIGAATIAVKAEALKRRCECWYNPETGYFEACSRGHEELISEAIHQGRISTPSDDNVEPISEDGRYYGI